MKKVKVHFFYRCGANYKCHFEKIINQVDLDELEIDMDNDIDHEARGDVQFEIEDFGLTVFDIPSIAEWGYKEEFDHNYVSITKIEDVENG